MRSSIYKSEKWPRRSDLHKSDGLLMRTRVMKTFVEISLMMKSRNNVLIQDNEILSLKFANKSSPFFDEQQKLKPF